MKKIVAILSLFIACSLANATETLTILLNKPLNPDHAPLIIAKQQGYFREQGLKVNWKYQSNSTGKLIAKNKADIGISYEPEYMRQIDAGLPLIRIGTLIDKPLHTLAVLRGSGIQSLNDLRGKRIGLGKNDLYNVMLKVMLLKSGLHEKDVQLTKIHEGLTQALLTHKVDAVTGITRNIEVPQMEARDKKVLTFFPEDHGIPSYSELIFISHIKNVHDKRYPRFLSAIKKAVRYLDEHPDLAWNAYINEYPEKNSLANQETWLDTMPYFAEDPASFNDGEWHRFANFMQKNQMIKKVQPTSRYAVILR